MAGDLVCETQQPRWTYLTSNSEIKFSQLIRFYGLKKSGFLCFFWKQFLKLDSLKQFCAVNAILDLFNRPKYCHYFYFFHGLYGSRQPLRRNMEWPPFSHFIPLLLYCPSLALLAWFSSRIWVFVWKELIFFCSFIFSFKFVSFSTCAGPHIHSLSVSNCDLKP